MPDVAHDVGGHTAERPDRKPVRHTARITGSGRLPLIGFIMIVLAASAIMLGADSADSRVRLHVGLTNDGFDLAWETPRNGAPANVEVQVRAQARKNDRWVDISPWRSVPTTDDVQKAVFDDVTVEHRYKFRARQGGRPWTKPINRLFVEPALPVLRIDVENRAAIRDRKKEYRDATVSLDPNGEDFAGIDSPARVRGRGNTTWDYVDEKKSYQIKFDSKQSLMGMAPSKRWVLRSNFYDRSQLRNWIANQISQATDLAWTPQTRWVELIINGDYAGIYEISEKIDIATDKIDIDKLRADDTEGSRITGGYLLEIDRNASKVGQHEGWISRTGYPVYIKRPKEKNSNPEQFDYIRRHVTAFENTLYSDDFTDPDTGYRRYLDVPSFIDYWIVEELTLDTDAFHWSTYFYKQRDDPKLYFGPAWDYDRALGSPYSRLDSNPLGWFTIHPDITLEDGTRTWAYRLFQDQAFADQVHARWKQIHGRLRQVPGELLEIGSALEPAKTSDLLRWVDEHDTFVGFRYGDVWENDQPAFIADWLTDRLDWMTEELERIASGESITDAAELNE